MLPDVEFINVWIFHYYPDIEIEKHYNAPFEYSEVPVKFGLERNSCFETFMQHAYVPYGGN
jgi:hypothetical protein